MYIRGVQIGFFAKLVRFESTKVKTGLSQNMFGFILFRIGIGTYLPFKVELEYEKLNMLFKMS